MSIFLNDLQTFVAESAFPKHELYSVAEGRTIETLFFDDVALPLDELGNKGFTGTKWEGGIVPYELDTNVTALQRTVWHEAASEWWRSAEVHWVPRANQHTQYIHIRSWIPADGDAYMFSGGLGAGTYDVMIGRPE